MTWRSKTMRSRLRREDGWAIPTALLVMSLMLALGLAGFAYSDGQQREAAGERIRESGFNLAEAAINAQAALLSAPSKWPTQSSPQVSCGRSSTSDRCPHPGSVLGAFSGGDYEGAEWTTQVRDNGTGGFYDDAATKGQPAYDSNSDGALWIRSQAKTRGRTRTLVALVQAESVFEPLPRNVVTAGFFATGNNGRKLLVDSRGGPISVRCTDPNPDPKSKCLGYDATKGQVQPDTRQVGYAGPSIVLPESAGGTGLLDRLRERAKAIGRYWGPGGHAGCPGDAGGSPTLNGSLTFIEGPLDCQWASNSVFNSSASPGTLVMASGTLRFAGRAVYYGMVINGCAGAGPESFGISTTGTSRIIGGVYTEGSTCGVSIGNAGGEPGNAGLTFDSNAHAVLASSGAVSVVPNSWREITPAP